RWRAPARSDRRPPARAAPGASLLFLYLGLPVALRRYLAVDEADRDDGATAFPCGMGAGYAEHLHARRRGGRPEQRLHFRLGHAVLDLGGVLLRDFRGSGEQQQGNQYQGAGIHTFTIIVPCSFDLLHRTTCLPFNPSTPTTCCTDCRPSRRRRRPWKKCGGATRTWPGRACPTWWQRKKARCWATATARSTGHAPRTAIRWRTPSM